MMRRGRVLLPLIVVAAAALLMPAEAVAHSSQIGSTPEAGATLDVPPREVTVEFDTPLLDVGAAMVVRTGDGVVVSTGAPRVDRRTLATAIATDAPDGTYTVAYRVVSKDGHTVESTFDFSVGTAPASPPPSTSASPAAALGEDLEPAAGDSTVVWIVAAVVVAVIVGVGVMVLRR